MELAYSVFNPMTAADRVLVVGSSLGGDARQQWTAVAEALGTHTVVVFVELPGHAGSPAWDDADEPTLQVLAQGFADIIDRLRTEFSALPFFFAGVSISGATALHIALEHADVINGVAVLSSAAKLGESETWLERARNVESGGTQQLLQQTEQRWFTPSFRAQHHGTVDTVMKSLADTDHHSYAQLCRAIAAHDVRNQLAGIRAPLLVIAGECDASTPFEKLAELVESVPTVELHVLPDAAHQVTVVSPGDIAALLLSFMQRNEPSSMAGQVDG